MASRGCLGDVGCYISQKLGFLKRCAGPISSVLSSVATEVNASSRASIRKSFTPDTPQSAYADMACKSPGVRARVTVQVRALVTVLVPVYNRRSLSGRRHSANREI